MINLLGISGSLRKNSYNTALLRAAAALAPADATLAVKTIHDIPLYNEDDEEAHGLPLAAQALKTEIAAADGLLLVTPEYNNSIPGPFKNAIDWVSRPAADLPRVFGGKPVALIGASPGGFGTVLAQNAWLSVLRTLGTKPWCGRRLMIPHAFQVFDATGQLTDEKVREQLRSLVVEFVKFATPART